MNLKKLTFFAQKIRERAKYKFRDRETFPPGKEHFDPGLAGCNRNGAPHLRLDL